MGSDGLIDELSLVGSDGLIDELSLVESDGLIDELSLVESDGLIDELSLVESVEFNDELSIVVHNVESIDEVSFSSSFESICPFLNINEVSLFVLFISCKINNKNNDFNIGIYVSEKFFRVFY